MKQLTPEGTQQINALAARYGLSQNAVLAMLQAVVNGGGSMAQFNIYELGGNGQWMRGGMTMVSDLFNHSLKNTVNNLCQELSNLMLNQNIFVATPQTTVGTLNFSNNWWPSALGTPSSSGSQNNIKYAFFPSPTSRLAIEINGEVSVYDTLNHHISGVSQQQGGKFSVLFSSQFGYVNILDLPIVSGEGTIKQEKAPTITLEVVEEKPQAFQPKEVSNPIEVPFTPAQIDTPIVADDNDIFNKIERLAGLFRKGILSEEEFSAKKSELLARL